jgi:glycerol uptake facilitator-like aquaporin
LNNASIEILPGLINRYYLVEFASCLAVSIGISSVVFMLNILSNESDNPSNPLLYYMISKTVQFFIAGIIISIFTNADTYRSVNVSVDFLAINWVLHDYTFPMVLKYMVIQLLACILGTLISIGMHYNILSKLPKTDLLNSIILVNPEYILTSSYILLSIFIHTINVIGLTFIMDRANSLNYHEKIFHKVIYIYGLSLLYCTIIGPLGFMIYRLTLYICISFIFDIHPNENNSIMIMVAVHLVIKLLIYPFISFHVKFVWKNSIRRYLEYQ